MARALLVGIKPLARRGHSVGRARQLAHGEFTTVELRPEGAGIDVCLSNVEDYVQCRLQERMMGSNARRLACLLLGVYDVMRVLR